LQAQPDYPIRSLNHAGQRRWAGAAPFGFKGADFDLVVGVEEAKRNALRRFYGSGDLHFVTFSCYRRRPYLGTVRARNRFVKILHEVRSRHGFALLGDVLMPEHVHLLMGKPEHGSRWRNGSFWHIAFTEDNGPCTCA